MAKYSTTNCDFYDSSSNTYEWHVNPGLRNGIMPHPDTITQFIDLEKANKWKIENYFEKSTQTEIGIWVPSRTVSTQTFPKENNEVLVSPTEEMLNLFLTPGEIPRAQKRKGRKQDKKNKLLGHLFAKMDIQSNPSCDVMIQANVNHIDVMTQTDKDLFWRSNAESQSQHWEIFPPFKNWSKPKYSIKEFFQPINFVIPIHGGGPTVYPYPSLRCGNHGAEGLEHCIARTILQMPSNHSDLYSGNDE